MNEQITVNLNNLTEEEREQFKTLVDKGRGKSSRESCVWKPKKGEVYYYINDCNDFETFNIYTNMNDIYRQPQHNHDFRYQPM